MNRYPLASLPHSSLPSLPVSLFPSSYSLLSSSLSLSNTQASFLPLLCFFYSYFWTLGLLTASVMTLNSNTASVAFLDPSSCLTVFGHVPTNVSCSCLNSVRSFCHAGQLNMIGWTSIRDLELHSQHLSLPLFSIRFRKLPVPACLNFGWKYRCKTRACLGIVASTRPCSPVTGSTRLAVYGRTTRC